MIENSGRRLLDIVNRFAALPTDSEEERLRKAAVVLASIVYAGLGAIWGLGYIALGFTVPGLIPATYAVITILFLVHYRLSRNFSFLRFAQLSCMLLLPILFQWSMGGFVKGSAVGLWAFAAPLGALVFSGPRVAGRWLAAFLALLAISAALDSTFAAMTGPVPPLLSTMLFAFNIAGVVCANYFLLAYFVRQRDAAQARSEQLLLNILPAAIAERLKHTPGIIADEFGDVTVLFADIVDFTPISARARPEQIINVLNEVFSMFDQLAEKHGLEKIKTIGDAYMVAAGLPTPRPDHTEAIAEMALDMLATLEQQKPTLDGQPVRVRIGINTGGPVIAGVIGTKKFIYDLWGDMVNTASRMESHGAGGKIQVTPETYERLKDRYTFEDRGLIPVKGKGEMRTFFMTGRRPNHQT